MDRLSPADAQALRDRLQTERPSAFSIRARVSPGTVMRAAAGLPVLPSTADAIRRALRTPPATTATEAP